MQSPVTKWITIPALVFAVLSLLVGIALYVSPEPFLPNVDTEARGAGLLLQLWAARQIALALPLGYAALRRSVPMLRLALAAYLIMQVQDCIIGAVNGDIDLSIGAGVIGILSAGMLYGLRRAGN